MKTIIKKIGKFLYILLKAVLFLGVMFLGMFSALMTQASSPNSQLLFLFVIKTWLLAILFTVILCFISKSNEKPVLFVCLGFCLLPVLPILEFASRGGF